jgi:hypothetical protein
MADLYEGLEDAERQRLLAAGWHRADYYGREIWLSPDKREGLSREEALRRLDREEAKHGGQ